MGSANAPQLIISIERHTQLLLVVKKKSKISKATIFQMRIIKIVDAVDLHGASNTIAVREQLLYWKAVKIIRL